MKRTKLPVLAALAAFSMAATAAVPQVSPEAKAAAEAINKDPVMQKILAEATSPEGRSGAFIRKWKSYVSHHLRAQK